MPDLPLPEKDTGEATASDCGTAPDTERELSASGPAETHPALPEPDEAKLPESPLEKCEKLEQLRALENGMRIKVIKTVYQSVGIDTPEELEKAERFLAELKRRGEEQ